MTVTTGELGAWLLKCNPRIWDLEGFIADGGGVIESWSVADNYRSGMMEYGQRALFWVTGRAGASLPRGLWGAGWVTGQMRAELEAAPEDEALDTGDSDVEGEQGVDLDGDDYWLDEGYRLRARLFVPCHVDLFDSPVPAASVVAVVGLENLEVLRQPQMSNPLWVNKDELALLEPLLPAWPDLPPGAPEAVTVSGSGAGYGEPETNAAVEHAAMTAVTKQYQARGWAVEDVSRRNLGWDLDCRSPQGVVERVEVKGVSGRRPTVLLTANEIRAAAQDSGWKVAVVTRALTAPSVTYYEAAKVLATADPYVYRAQLGE